MKINLNDRVRVTVTATGVKAWNEFYAKFEAYGIKTPPMAAGQTHKDQLWQIMRIFGPTLMMGFDGPIETEIEILGRDGEGANP